VRVYSGTAVCDTKHEHVMSFVTDGVVLWAEFVDSGGNQRGYLADDRTITVSCPVEIHDYNPCWGVVEIRLDGDDDTTGTWRDGEESDLLNNEGERIEI
jgi:hypothetical protein